jgi:hypothetical protein
MKTFKATAMLAIAALSMAAAPAMAASFVMTGSDPHNAPGSFTAGGFGQNYDCGITTFEFTTSSTTLTSVTGTSVLVTNPGSQPCNSTSGTFDTFVVTPVSTTQIKVAQIKFNAPFGVCTKNNVLLPWANGATNSTITVTSPIAIGLCQLKTLNLTAERITIV